MGKTAFDHPIDTAVLAHLTPKTAKKHPWTFIQGLFSIAGKGFEPHDLRVMSPTSYQTALPRDIQFRQRKCRTPGSNRYDTFVSRDFKSRASANSATPAHNSLMGYPLAAHIVYHIHPCLSIGFIKIFFRLNIRILQNHDFSEQVALK